MIVILSELTKRYQQTPAVDRLDLTIRKGECFGLLGPNGAGKSTTIHMLAGLLKPDSGAVAIDGIDPYKNPLQAKTRLGVVPQEIALYETLSAAENVAFFGALAGLRKEKLKNQVQEALAFSGLTDYAKKRPKTFSGGMKRRLNIACAIVHKPAVIVMDEPTVGIDPQSRNHIMESVRQLNKEGTTVIYTTHYMEEVEALCQNIAIMDRGRVIAQGTKQQLRALVKDTEKIRIEGGRFDEHIRDLIGKLDQVAHVDGSEEHLDVTVTSAQSVVQALLDTLFTHRKTVKQIVMETPDLETVFLSLTGKTLRDA